MHSLDPNVTIHPPIFYLSTWHDEVNNFVRAKIRQHRDELRAASFYAEYWLSASEEKFVSLNITYVDKAFGYFSWNLGCQKVPFAGTEEAKAATLAMLDAAVESLHLPAKCELIRYKHFFPAYISLLTS